MGPGSIVFLTLCSYASLAFRSMRSDDSSLPTSLDIVKRLIASEADCEQPSDKVLVSRPGSYDYLKTGTRPTGLEGRSSRLRSARFGDVEGECDARLFPRF